MKKSFRAAFAFLLALSLSPFHALAQQQPPPAQPPTLGPPPRTTTPPDVTQADVDDDDVVRITTNLVQFDVVVTDKKGRQVTDLKPEEFEVLSNGKPQQITNFSYVSNDAAVEAPAAVAAAPADKNAPPAPPVPPARLKREQVRRTIAVVVDDLSTSWTSVYAIRRALKKLVDEHMQPGDLVAIIRTRGGAGALQQFTSDKRVLYAAIESLRWYPQGGGLIGPFERIGSAYSPQVGEAERLFDELRRERFTVGTLLTVEQVIRGLEELPGRKSLVLLGDGIPLPSADTGSERVMAGLNRLIETANRASVTVYPVDARGLLTTSVYDAANDLSGYTPQDLAAISTQRGFGVWESQKGMEMLAAETGGVAYRNTNDIGGSVRRALEDQRGFYLIGYRPEPGTFDSFMHGRNQFHKLTVRVKRPGLRVRTRGGFFGFTDRARPAALRAGGPSLMAALTSPFGASGVPLRLTTLFGHDPKNGSFVRSILHVDGRKLTFRDEPDGWRRATLDVLAIITGANGMPIGQISQTRGVRVKDDVYRRILEGGLIYNMVVPAKKAGVYQLRVAVRDAATQEVGSASQVVEVPDIKKGRLALSGIVMSSRRAAQPQAAPKEGESEADATAPDPSGGPALRRFRHGASVEYAFNILNAKLEKATGRPQLQTQMRLFREGKPVYTGPARPFDAGPQTAPKPVIGVGGGLRLDSTLPPGEYVLQLVVTDLLANEKHRTATQWIDFEIVTSDK